MKIYWPKFLGGVEPEPTFVKAEMIQPTASHEGGPSRARSVFSFLDGEKFAGGFGPTKMFFKDYWTLRERSIQIFEESLYGKGLIRRLITNEINTGLFPEVIPEELILGLKQDDLSDWSETVEVRFGLWARNPKICDFKQQKTFGEIQRIARMEALLGGDILVVMRRSAKTQLPQIQIISGGSIINPVLQPTNLRNGHKIVHGVEVDSKGRHVAFYIRQKDGKTERMAAFGEKSGRRIAWLVHGTENLVDDVRGTPLLGIILQSIKELDRYRDAAQRKAVVNSIVAMFIRKTQENIGSNPLQGGAVLEGEVTATDGSNSKISRLLSYIPGFAIEELQYGEEPVPYSNNGTDVNFGPFEEVIVQAMAWVNEIPPEILKLSFSSNYSASQAAINEFKMYLNKVRSEFGFQFCQPIYVMWLVSEVLMQKIEAKGLVEAWRDPLLYDIFGSWTAADWSGAIKPAMDTKKMAEGYALMLEMGAITRAKMARELTGTKYSKNVQRLKIENEQLVEAMKPLLELKQLEKTFGKDAVAEARLQIEGDMDSKIEEAIGDIDIKVQEAVAELTEGK